MPQTPLPFAPPDRIYPAVEALKVWAGLPRDMFLPSNALKELRKIWKDEMRARGFVVAWIDPATGRQAVHDWGDDGQEDPAA